MERCHHCPSQVDSMCHPTANCLTTPWLCPMCAPYLFTVFNHLALWNLGAGHLLPPPLHCPVQELLHLPLWEHAGAPQQLVFIFINCGERRRVRCGKAAHTGAGTSALPSGWNQLLAHAAPCHMDPSAMSTEGKVRGQWGGGQQSWGVKPAN